TVIGGAIPTVNLKGIKPGQLKLTPNLLAGIYLGNIKKWDDATIKAVNPGLALPSTDINVVHRSDGSGTTFIWSNYLSKVSAEWKSKVGEGTSVNWPVGVGGKGNEGVASYAKQFNGSIGYVEYAYALQNKLTYTLLQNAAGKFVSPTAAAFQASAANADWSKAPGFHLLLTDQPGDASWPISGATFILVYKTQDKPETGREVLKFFDWAYHNGGKMAEELAYVPMPDAVVKLVEKTWADQVKGADGKPVYVAGMAQK
ncbi:MAG TPA: phosphate ABC transporter substrate-binding protein PstS, partial [Candidatus Cybelea sp.]|nr:phosphate ABC transporter substrate-binding protein PstS [Candidatus Cybelea sp.]